MKRPIRFVTSVGTALLLAANAGVTASATTEWHADGRDGAQVLDGFSLTEVYRDKQVYDWAFAPEPGGHSFLALRRELDAKTMMDTGASVVRFTADDQGRLSQSVVLDIEALRDPVLWDAGVDLAAADLYTDALSVAPSGDAFVSAGASMDGTIAASTLVRIAPDGSLQKVVTAGELGATGIFPPAIRYPWVHVVAASDGVLWGHAEGYDPSTDQLTRLIQIVDPTDDGDWSDRIVRPLVLSASIPQLEDGVWDWRYGDFVPDGLAADADGPGSVLFPIVGRDGDYQVHRLTDTQGDGILDVAGESELIFRHQSDPGSLWMIAPRLTAGAPGDGSWALLRGPHGQQPRLRQLKRGRAGHHPRALQPERCHRPGQWLALRRCGGRAFPIQGVCPTPSCAWHPGMVPDTRRRSRPLPRPPSTLRASTSSRVGS